MKHKNPRKRILMFFNAINENNLLEKQSHTAINGMALLVIAFTPAILLLLLYH